MVKGPHASLNFYDFTRIDVVRATGESSAEICRVDPSTYARWERGTQLPYPRNYQVLMEIFDLYDEIWPGMITSVPDTFLPPRHWNN